MNLTRSFMLLKGMEPSGTNNLRELEQKLHSAGYTGFTRVDADGANTLSRSHYIFNSCNGTVAASELFGERDAHDHIVCALNRFEQLTFSFEEIIDKVAPGVRSEFEMFV